MKEITFKEWLKFNRKEIPQLAVAGSFTNGNYFDAIIVHYLLYDIKERMKTIDIIARSLKDKGRIFIREPTRKSHGMPPEEIRKLMLNAGFLERNFREGYFFPLRGKVFFGKIIWIVVIIQQVIFALILLNVHLLSVFLMVFLLHPNNLQLTFLQVFLFHLSPFFVAYLLNDLLFVLGNKP